MNTKKCYTDLETFSHIPLENGTHAYAEHAEIIVQSYAVDEGDAKVWDCTSGSRMPNELEDSIYDERVKIVMHNGGMFDRTIWRYVKPEIFSVVTPDRMIDVMVQAMCHGLPGSLDKLCEILNLDAGDRKLKSGKTLIQLFCKPQTRGKIERATRETHPAEWGTFLEYARMDIPSMREVHKRLPEWNHSGVEHKIWELDQKINNRGFQCDIELAEAAITAIEKAQAALNVRTAEITSDQVQKATKRDQLLKHILAEYGVDLPDMQKSTLERRITDENLPWALRELLAIRLQSSSTSGSKYKTLIKGVNSEGRLCGTLQYAGAQRTLRWAGRLFQPQNLMRPNMKWPEILKAITFIKAGIADIIYY